MPRANGNPLAKLTHRELLWLFTILEDACRERLEKNLVNQQLEARLAKRGPVPGRPDPRAALELWEPRYRKLLAVATELHHMARTAETGDLIQCLTGEFERRGA